MSRVERIGDCTLYLGDCREVLASLGPVDHVITDPPFEKEAHTLQRRALGRGSADGHRDIKDAALPFEAITAEDRLSVSAQMGQLASGWVLVFCQAEAVANWREALELGGVAYRRAMVWLKPDGMPQFTGDRPGMGYESIVAGWAGSGKSHWHGGGRHGVFTFTKHDTGSGHGGAGNPHPTTKPQRLMAELVRLFTGPGDTILDPYMGSGSTGSAAVAQGRKFIGVEARPDYFEIACDKVYQAYRQPRLFSEPVSKPKQSTLFDGDAA
jgi:site-specific DNA-methyltransferase (adenine-specific)